jgi:hypothetical protein
MDAKTIGTTYCWLRINSVMEWILTNDRIDLHDVYTADRVFFHLIRLNLTLFGYLACPLHTI